MYGISTWAASTLMCRMIRFWPLQNSERKNAILLPKKEKRKYLISLLLALDPTRKINEVLSFHTIQGFFLLKNSRTHQHIMDDKGGRPREEENGTRFASQLPITYFQGQLITKHSKSGIGDDHFYHANIELFSHCDSQRGNCFKCKNDDHKTRIRFPCEPRVQKAHHSLQVVLSSKWFSSLGSFCCVKLIGE